MLGATGVLTHEIVDELGYVTGQSQGPTLLLLMLTTAGLVGGFVGVIAVALVDPGWLRTRDEAPLAVPVRGSAPAPPERAWVVIAAVLAAAVLGSRRR